MEKVYHSSASVRYSFPVPVDSYTQSIDKDVYDDNEVYDSAEVKGN